MSYIQPQTSIEFFGDLGLSPEYDDTLYFPSASAKDNYFSAVPIIARAESCSYTRGNRGIIRVEKPMSTLIRASYMRFKNTLFENKWFYAFVSKVEYVNNSCTEISFTIDYVMTWMGDFTLGQCFVERQHTVNDAIGANIADEHLDTGEYICQGFSSTQLMTDYRVAFLSPKDPEGTVGGGVFGGIYSGVVLDDYAVSEASAALNTMSEEDRESLVGIKMYPSHYTVKKYDPSPVIDSFAVSKPYSSIGQYVPKNNKLFTYPYNLLVVYNCEGETAEYKYEYFNALPPASDSTDCIFSIDGFVNAECEISCMPRNYKGQQTNLTERITMRDFPTCAIGVDAYKAYIAQVQSNIPFNIANTVVSAGIGLATGGTAGAAIAGASGAGAVVGDLATLALDKLGGAPHKIMPDQLKGAQSVNLLVGERIKDFYFYKMCINENYARMIDDYFTAFGYAIRQVITPNMAARPHWTYVKTSGCIVHGNIPADDAAFIERQFDKGIRFWRNHSEIGNYSADNSPV